MFTLFLQEELFDRLGATGCILCEPWLYFQFMLFPSIQFFRYFRPYSNLIKNTVYFDVTRLEPSQQTDEQKSKQWNSLPLVSLHLCSVETVDAHIAPCHLDEGPFYPPMLLLFCFVGLPFKAFTLNFHAHSSATITRLISRQITVTCPCSSQWVCVVYLMA